MIRNFSSYCLLSILICFVADTVCYEAMINAHKAGENQFPYQIELWYEKVPVCGGGIIHVQFVITAAHCVIDGHTNDFRKGHFFILAGTNDLRKPGPPAKARDVVRIFALKKWKPNNPRKTDDIAVLKLRHPLELAHHINKVDLPNHESDTFFGKEAVIAGFGWHWAEVTNGTRNGGKHDTHLRYAKADILQHIQVSPGTMRDVPKELVHAKVHRADHSKPSGTCQGDSGNPLVYGKTVVGILSESPVSCLEIMKGSLYTSTAHYLPFIKLALQDIKQHNDIRIRESP